MKQTYKDCLQWLAARLKEPSTWRGVTYLLMATGITVSPEKLDAVLVLGTSIVGFILVMTKEPGKE